MGARQFLQWTELLQFSRQAQKMNSRSCILQVGTTKQKMKEFYQKGPEHSRGVSKGRPKIFRKMTWNKRSVQEQHSILSHQRATRVASVVWVWTNVMKRNVMLFCVVIK